MNQQRLICQSARADDGSDCTEGIGYDATSTSAVFESLVSLPEGGDTSSSLQV